jgi:hypothetical protein
MLFRPSPGVHHFSTRSTRPGQQDRPAAEIAVLDHGPGFYAHRARGGARSVNWLHCEAAPPKSNIDIVLGLLPSLFPASSIVRTMQVDRIEGAATTEHGGMTDEIVECVRLKGFGNLVQKPRALTETGKYREMKLFA